MNYKWIAVGITVVWAVASFTAVRDEMMYIAMFFLGVSLICGAIEKRDE